MRDERTYTVYTHRVVTDDKGPMWYVGVTSDIKRRWRPREYNDSSLWSYIENYGWDNIEHRVIADGLDREMALKLEDCLICMYRSADCCINEQRSGLITTNINKYHCQLRCDNQEYAERCRKLTRKYQKERYANDQEYAERQRQWHRDKRKDPEWAEKRRQYSRQYSNEKYANDPKWVEIQRQRSRANRSTTEGKIYQRVHNFNRRHPDCAIETPLEAKLKYLESGYIPDYIKNDDL